MSFRFQFTQADLEAAQARARLAQRRQTPPATDPALPHAPNPTRGFGCLSNCLTATLQRFRTAVARGEEYQPLTSTSPLEEDSETEPTSNCIRTASLLEIEMVRSEVNPAKRAGLVLR